MTRNLLVFMAKPRQNNFGGNDTFAIQLIERWPDKRDHIVFAINASHPCADLFESRLRQRAELLRLNEELIIEKRARLSSYFAPRGKVVSILLEAGLDILRPFLAVAAIFRLYRVLSMFHPEVVILNVGGNPPEDLGWRMMLAAWLRRTPQIILVNHSFPGHATNPFRRIGLLILQRMTKFFCDVLVVPSQDMAVATARSMRDRRPPIVIPNGIEPEPEPGLSYEEKRKVLGLKKSMIIGALASMEECKGIYYLVEAMKGVVQQYPDVELIIIGVPVDPDYVKNVLQLIRTLGLETHVKYVGYLPQAHQYFECIDIGVVPSVYAESFGIVAIEAMRYAKPVVAARTGGLKEIVVDGETGYLVAPRDSEALAAALKKLLASPSLRESMGQEGKKRFLSLYITSKMVDRYYQLTQGTSSLPSIPFKSS